MAGGGNDHLRGGAGDDRLILSDQDWVRGGADADIFVIDGDEQSAQVEDFRAMDGDIVDLTGLRAEMIGLDAGEDPIAAGYISFVDMRGWTRLTFDADGAAGAGEAVVLASFSGASVEDLTASFII